MSGQIHAIQQDVYKRQACAMIKTELDSMPAELDELQRKIMQLEIEEEIGRAHV